MSRKFILQTRKGQCDSLQKRTTVELELTAAGTNGYFHEPVKHSMTFDSNVDSIQEFVWEPKVEFIAWRDPGRGVSTSPPILAGQSVTMTRRGDDIAWSTPERSEILTSAIVVNNIGTMRKVRPHDRAAYQDVQARDSFVVSMNSTLQIYVVDDSGYRKPQFPAPLDCISLPATPKWTLRWDARGAIELTHEDEDKERHGASCSPGELGKAFSDMKDQLSAVLTSLGETQQRLTTMEKSVNDYRTELTIVRNDAAATRERLERLDCAVTKVAGLDTSLIRTENRVAVVEKLVERAQVGLASEKQNMDEVHGRLLAVEQSMGVATVGLTRVQTALNTTRGELSDLVDRRAPAVEAKADDQEKTPVLAIMMQKNIELAHDRLSTLDRRVLAVETKVDTSAPKKNQKVNNPATVPEALSEITQQVVVIEGRTEELEKSFSENQRAVRKFMRTLDRRFPAVETKADRLEESLGLTEELVSVMRASLGTTEDKVTRLERKVASIEESMAKIQEPLSAEGSPYIFPSQLPPGRDPFPVMSRGAPLSGRYDSDSS